MHIILEHGDIMKTSKLLVVLFISLFLLSEFACQNKPADREAKQVEEGEESGFELALDEKYDTVRNGARLILVYDSQTNSFVGSVENTTDKTLKKVRVEVHLSNGIELGPTTPVDLEPEKKMDIKLTTTSKEFVGWTAHPEVGGEEQGHGEERDEHKREESEHKGEHKDEHREEHGERH